MITKAELISKIMNKIGFKSEIAYDNIVLNETTIIKILQDNIPEVDMDTRDFNLCDIFNTTKTKAEIYTKIIGYLVDEGFLQYKKSKGKDTA